MLSQINAIFSERTINIAGEYLQTNARIGYVVIDVEDGERGETLEAKRLLDEVEGTIRTRISILAEAFFSEICRSVPLGRPK